MKKCLKIKKLNYSPSGGVPGAPGEEDDEDEDEGVGDGEPEEHGAGALGHEGGVIRQPLIR